MTSGQFVIKIMLLKKKNTLMVELKYEEYAPSCGGYFILQVASLTKRILPTTLPGTIASTTQFRLVCFVDKF